MTWAYVAIVLVLAVVFRRRLRRAWDLMGYALVIFAYRLERRLREHPLMIAELLKLYAKDEPRRALGWDPANYCAPIGESDVCYVARLHTFRMEFFKRYPEAFTFVPTPPIYLTSNVGRQAMQAELEAMPLVADQYWKGIRE